MSSGTTTTAHRLALLKLSGLLLSILLLNGCASLMFFPDRHNYYVPPKLQCQIDDVVFPSGDLRLHGWWIPANNQAHGTILFLHGNAQNISAHLASVYWLPEQGFNVFLFDYRGYGQSQGKPDLNGVHQDFQAAMNYLLTREDIDKGKIVVFGQSLGATIAINGLAQNPYRSNVRALVVEGAFASYRRVAREKLNDFWLTWLFQWPLSFTIPDDIRPVDNISKLAPTPLLLVHGKTDTVIPAQHALDLYAAAKEPKDLWLFEDTPHIHAFVNPHNREKLVEYLKQQLSD